MAAVGLLLSGCAQVHSGSAQRDPDYDATAANPAVDYDKKPYPTSAIAIPRHPESHAWTYQEDRFNDPAQHVVQAFTPRGPVVLAQTAQTLNASDSAELIAKTLDQQGPLIDAFVPTPQDKLTEVPLDPTGLWARLLPTGEGSHDAREGVYGPQGARALYAPRAEDQAVFTEVGVDLLGVAQGYVVRTRDAAGARKLLEYNVADYQKSGYTERTGAPGLPQTRCLAQSEKAASGLSPWIRCLGIADRYLIDINGAQETIAKQRLTAQYLMLTPN